MTPSSPLRQRPRPLSLKRQILTSEAGGGLVLMAAAAAALLVANSLAAPVYFETLQRTVAGLSVAHWINDGLMAVFFLLVGLEIKREVLDGHLSTWPRRILPGVAAIGGMFVPALFYLAFKAATPETLRGWAIPSATDIAFSLGVLALLGSRAPASLKIFLTALAIIDDLGAVIIIAAFYTNQLNLWALASALTVVGCLIGLNVFQFKRLPPYLVLGVLLWFLVLKSGVHATLAGVALALTIPTQPSPGRPDDMTSPLHVLEHAIQPWVAFLIVPIFGFANAGVSFAGINLAALFAPVTLGIASGLFLGKQIGIFLTARCVVAMGFADCPEHASWLQVYGVSLLCGIGFTMSLFIGLLAFPNAPALQDEVKIGVLLGSIFSAVLGALVLVIAPRPGHAPN